MAPPRNEHCKEKDWKKICKASIARKTLSTRGQQECDSLSILVAGTSTEIGLQYDKTAEAVYQNVGTADYEQVNIGGDGDLIHVNTMCISTPPTGGNQNETRVSH